MIFQWDFETSGHLWRYNLRSRAYRMAAFTCITNVRESFHLTQHDAQDATAALRAHILALPYDDATDDEREWLRRVWGGSQEIKLSPVERCNNTWLWLDGARNEPQYLTYIVKTDMVR